MLEKDVERRFVEGVEALGGMTAKLTVEGRRGWPDRLVVLPGGVIFFVELKRPKGGSLSAVQKGLHERLRRLGARLFQLRSLNDVDSFLGVIGRMHGEWLKFTGTMMDEMTSRSGERHGSKPDERKH